MFVLSIDVSNEEKLKEDEDEVEEGRESGLEEEITGEEMIVKVDGEEEEEGKEGEQVEVEDIPF